MLSTIAYLSAATVTGLWWIFHRPSRVLLDDPPKNLPEGMQVVSRLSEEEKNAIVTAFLKGPDFRWLVSGKNYKTDLDPKRHWIITSYMLNAMLNFSGLYGNLFACRDKDGSFLGVVTIVPPYKSHTLFFLHFARSVMTLGRPPSYSWGKDATARFDAFNACMEEHKNAMKGVSHYYIPLVGVSEAAQGKGVGRKLLQTAKIVADNVPFYLDCHDGNVAFYEKQGMAHRTNYPMVPKGFEEDKFSYNGMTFGL
eukprot:CAMPEP_0197439246 /NCGR_PEP_ID=MMETSP1175-20131217/6032_1 /TAXON_ID=1003142 /ORGANISM="Triceratium dubium, Strain CCMP147" /LENGTH=252 /DNA_ID=CAMNT_0042969123 /DNA_START=74 /DNA_END=832 /DNA_ORIENTATION=-